MRRELVRLLVGVAALVVILVPVVLLALIAEVSGLSQAAFGGSVNLDSGRIVIVAAVSGAVVALAVLLREFGREVLSFLGD